MHIVWEFLVLEEKVAAFVSAYGAHGEWAQLFSRAEGFLGTQLLRSSETPNRFITIDRWTDPASFEAFKEKFGAEYKAMDAGLEGLTLNETRIGVFSEA